MKWKPFRSFANLPVNYFTSEQGYIYRYIYICTCHFISKPKWFAIDTCMIDWYKPIKLNFILYVLVKLSYHHLLSTLKLNYAHCMPAILNRFTLILAIHSYLQFNILHNILHNILLDKYNKCRDETNEYVEVDLNNALHWHIVYVAYLSQGTYIFQMQNVNHPICHKQFTKHEKRLRVESIAKTFIDWFII